jgi:hypothetical protein
MHRKEVYKKWTINNSKWNDWIRPVPFIGIDKPKHKLEIINYDIPKIYYINKYKKNIAIIIDISGVDSVKEGIALAHLGYKPVPVFNGTNPNLNTKSVTDNEIIESLLVWGSKELENIKLKENANPVFLLDVNRLIRYKLSPSLFDNSYDIYDQDLPSSKFFLNNGIDTIIVRGEKIEKDLNKILYQYKKDNLKILFTNGYEEPKEALLKKAKREL